MLCYAIRIHLSHFVCHILQPRDQFISRLLKKLKVDDVSVATETQNEAGQEVEESWEDLASDEVHCHLFSSINTQPAFHNLSVIYRIDKLAYSC